MAKFFPLHVHSHYSILDGLSKPSAIAKRLEQLEYDGCALTDHGSISGAVAYTKALKAKKKKVILGSEFYITPFDPTVKDKDKRQLSHIVVLAKNKQGWTNLVQAVSEANRPEHFYGKPRLNYETLGLFAGQFISFSGHPGSDLANLLFTDCRLAYATRDLEECYKLLDPDWRKIVARKAYELQDMFGKGNFFIEIQLIDKDKLPAATVIAECLRQISSDTNIPCVATPDAHYPSKEDAFDQQVILCTKLNSTLREVDKKIVHDEEFGLSGFFRSRNYHIPSLEEMVAIHTEDELDNTMLIASMCEEYDITGQPKPPKFPTPDGVSSAEYLRKLCRDGWAKRLSLIERVMQEKGLTKADYGARVKLEDATLTDANLHDYFLVVDDIIRWERSQGGLIGCGRGSAAGSLILYLLEVTDIDPLEYDLLWERFYNAGRNSPGNISLPDVDMDFETQSRGRIIEYLKTRYGRDKVCQVSTFSRMQGRSALKDVLRVHEACSAEEMNRITEIIPDEAEIKDLLEEMRKLDRESGGDGEASIIDWALDNHGEDLSQWCYKDDDGNLQGPMAKRFEQAIRLEGTIRSVGKHAAGIVIAPEPLSTLCPMDFDSKTKEQKAGMEYTDLEAMGMVKFDILGIAMLDKVHGIQDLLRRGRSS